MALCTVCHGTNREQVDKLLAEGRSQRWVAMKFGLSKDAVRRHAINEHSATGLREGYEGEALPENATPAEMMRAALRMLHQVDLRKLSPNAVVQRAQAIRQISSDLAKLDDGPKVVERSVNDVRGMPEFIQVLFETLEVAPCSACGHHMGNELRDQIAAGMEKAGISEVMR